MTTLSETTTVATEFEEPIARISRDLRAAVKTMTPAEARYLVDAYYAMQKQRVRSGNQLAAATKGEEPHRFIEWFHNQSDALEQRVKTALDAYSRVSDIGRWLRQVNGIGPVIAAGLLAHVDWTKPTFSHLWRFAGLDPTVKWEKGQRRPWNASLKRLCWIIGGSFCKMSGNPKCYYGHLYLKRKEQEIAKNVRGDFAGQAAAGAARVGKSTESWPWYAGCYGADAEAMAEYYAGDTASRPAILKAMKGPPGSGVAMLPPLQIDMRSRRWAVKQFLADAYVVGHFVTTGKMQPRPYAIAHLEHVHLRLPPHMDEIVGLEEALREAWGVA